MPPTLQPADLPILPEIGLLLSASQVSRPVVAQCNNELTQSPNFTAGEMEASRGEGNYTILGQSQDLNLVFFPSYSGLSPPQWRGAERRYMQKTEASQRVPGLASAPTPSSPTNTKPQKM